MRTLLLAGLVPLVTGCPSPVDETFPSDYASWPDPIAVVGEAPGHGDTYRVIYYDDNARNAASTDYPIGTTIVKEIRDNDDGQPGDLRYLAIMRKIGVASADEGGWLFSQADEPGADEVTFAFCWGRCHAGAPYNGAFYDYRVPTP